MTRGDGPTVDARATTWEGRERRGMKSSDMGGE
jgi:hypothetical protein